MSLTRITTVQSQKSITYDTTVVDDTIIDPPEGETLEKGVEPDDDYEGIHNRGWVCAIGAFLINFFLSGITLTYGNYMNKQVFKQTPPPSCNQTGQWGGGYLSVAFPGSSALEISFIGSMQIGLINLLGLVLPIIIQSVGYRGTMIIGGILAPLGLICASFTNELWQLYITQGLMFGIGGALGYQPAMMIPAQYLRRNRSLAAGICICGSGMGGLAMSPVVQALISNYGYKVSLRYLGIIGFVIMAIGILLSKPKYEMPRTNKGLVLVNTSLLTLPMCLLLLFSFLVPFGYFIPFYLIPMYSVSIGLEASQGSLIVAVGSGVNAVFRVVFGLAADRWIGRMNVMFALTCISGIVTMAIWPFAKSYGALLLYFILYNTSAGVFQSVLPAITTDLVGVENLAHGMTMYFLAAGPGFLLGTPIAGQIFDATDYVTTIEVSGALSVLASLAALALRCVVGGCKPFAKV